jgi:hypothetical protein
LVLIVNCPIVIVWARNSLPFHSLWYSEFSSEASVTHPPLHSSCELTYRKAIFFSEKKVKMLAQEAKVPGSISTKEDEEQAL